MLLYKHYKSLGETNNALKMLKSVEMMSGKSKNSKRYSQIKKSFNAFKYNYIRDKKEQILKWKSEGRT